MNERNDESDAPQRAQLGRRAFLKRLAGVTALAAA
jgi:hypothetical protein